MTATKTDADTASALALLAAAESQQRIVASAAGNIRRWLTDPRYVDFVAEVCRHIGQGQWDVLNDVFCRKIPFGTAGRRGQMYPIGSNAINTATIAETAQGLADYLRGQGRGSAQLRCAVGYDPRHRSREFAQLCCEIMAAAGIEVYLLDGTWSTPLLSFTVREKHCDCGIMVTASHNPPTDNAIKVFWSGGAQVRPPHDAGILQAIEAVRSITRVPFDAALANGRIICCQVEMDRRYRSAVLRQSHAGPRQLKILYSPLHGVGSGSVLPVLREDGFHEVKLFAAQAEPDGDFPNVPDHIANPERAEVFEPLIGAATECAAELILASDPDADRIGCAAPVTPGGTWRALSGNQIGALLTDFVCRKQASAGLLVEQSYVVKTLVTSDFVQRTARLYGVRTYGDVLTGFKWIAETVDNVGAEHFLLGVEEAHGYMVGNYVRDKDAAVAAMLLAELAAELAQQNQTLHQALEQLYERAGYHAESSFARTFGGAQGMEAMRRTMERLRTNPPTRLAGQAVVAVRDYLQPAMSATLSTRVQPAESERDLIVFDLADGSRAATRPSGTEPKLKFYLFGYRPSGSWQRLDEVSCAVGEQLLRMRAELLSKAGLAS